MVEELKLAIKIDDATIEQSLLKQFANAQKMADKVVLDFKNVNFDDKQIEAKFKEMQKKAGQNPIDLTIGGNTLDMLGQIDKRLTEIFSIGKGKSFIDSSSIATDIGKIENKINELNKKYEESQKKLSSIGSGGISGKDVNLVDNEEFKKLSQEVSELKNQFDDLKTHMQLLDDYTVPTDRFFELQSQVETTTVKVSDLVEEFAKLSNAQKALSSTPQESNISLGDSKEQSTEIDLYHNLEKRKVTYDEIIDKIQTIISLKEKEKSLNKTSDDTKLYQKLYDENDINWAGDTEGTINRISDRLKEIYIKYNGKISLINENDIQEAAYLLDILKGAGESPNLNKSQEKFYQNKKFSNDSLFDNIHVDSQKTGEIDKINTELSETYRWFNQLEGVPLNENIANEIKSLISDMQIGGKNANEYANDLLKIFNIEVGSNSVVEQQNKLQSELKETESQAEKTTMAVKEVSSTASTEQKKDAFPKTSENLEQVAQSEQKVQQEAVATDKALDNISFTPNTEGFDDIIAKFGILREQAEQITKIVKTTKQTADGTPDISYKATLRNGSSYYLGENSTPQVLNASETVYDAKAVAKNAEQEAKAIQAEWDKNIKAIQDYMDAMTKLNNLKAKDKGTGSEANQIELQTQNVEKLKQVAWDARKNLSSMQAENPDIIAWKQWVDMMELFDQASKGSAESAAKLKDVLDNIKVPSLDKYENKLASYQTKKGAYNATIARFNDGGWTSDEYLKNVQAVKDAVKKYEDLLNNIKAKGGIASEDDVRI